MTATCVQHAFGDILTRESRMGPVRCLFRVECLCGWSSPWWASVASLIADVHAHRHRRGAARFGRRCVR